MIQTISAMITGTALVSYCTLALFTLRSRAIERRYFAFYLSGMIYWQFASLMVVISQTQAQALFWYLNFTIGAVSTIILFFLFTRVSMGIQDQKQVVYLAGTYMIILVLTTLAGLLTPSLHLGKGEFFVPDYNSNQLIFLVIPSFIFMGLAMFNLISGYRKAKSPYFQNRIKYLILGASLVFLGALSNLTPLQDYPVDIICNLINACLIGYAVIKHRLLDIRVLLVKTLFYTIISGVALGAYVLSIAALVRIINDRIDLPSVIAAIIVVILVILFLPVKDKIQSVIDRIFFREKYCYQQALAHFSVKILSIHDPREILNLMMTTLSNTVKADKTFIMLFKEEENQFHVERFGTEENDSPDQVVLEKKTRIINWLNKTKKPLVVDEAKREPELRSVIQNSVFLDRTGVSLIVPIIFQDNLVGTLNLGEKPTGDVYSDSDLQFLTTLVNQAAVAFDNAVLYQELERRVQEKADQILIQERTAVLGRLTESIGHDINNPLQYVKGNAELIMDLVKSGELALEELPSMLKPIIEGCERINETSNRLRRVSRRREIKTFDLHETILTAITMTRGRWKSVCKEISVEHALERPLFVEGVENDIAHVFMNLLVNAVQAIEEVGSISIRMHKSGQNIIVEVEDTGMGIPSDVMAKLGKETITTKPVGEGTGLGLLGAYNIVLQHHGFIEVESNTGSGTVFRVKLPISDHGY